MRVSKVLSNRNYSRVQIVFSFLLVTRKIKSWVHVQEKLFPADRHVPLSSLGKAADAALSFVTPPVYSRPLPACSHTESDHLYSFWAPSQSVALESSSLSL